MPLARPSALIRFKLLEFSSALSVEGALATLGSGHLARGPEKSVWNYSKLIFRA
jgi:hypothetical protein